MELTLEEAIAKVAYDSAIRFIDREAKGWQKAHGHELKEIARTLGLLFDEEPSSVYDKLSSKEHDLIEELRG